MPTLIPKHYSPQNIIVLCFNLSKVHNNMILKWLILRGVQITVHPLDALVRFSLCELSVFFYTLQDLVSRLIPKCSKCILSGLDLYDWTTGKSGLCLYNKPLNFCAAICWMLSYDQLSRLAMNSGLDLLVEPLICMDVVHNGWTIWILLCCCCSIMVNVVIEPTIRTGACVCSGLDHCGWTTKIGGRNSKLNEPSEVFMKLDGCSLLRGEPFLNEYSWWIFLRE